MKTQKSTGKFLLAFLLATCITSFSKIIAQQTLINVNGWNTYVHVPWDYNANSPEQYATIIFIPGLGEVGTNAASVIANGPGAFIKMGWNGNVKVGKDSVKFIVISLQPPSAWPGTASIDSRIQMLKSMYKIDKNKMHLTGLSMGGWASMCFVTADNLGGPYYYASQVASVVSIEGVQASDNAPWPNRFDNMALFGGRMVNIEQVNDYRLGDVAVARMNGTKPGSGQYLQTNYGGGGHCCWEQFYGGNAVLPNNFMLDGISQTLYEWIARNPLQTLGSLPVTLTDFTARNNKETVDLNWLTTSEKNSNYFEIERSNDGVKFEKLGVVYSKGNSTAVNQYSYNDAHPLKGNNFYRLSIVDINGKTGISKTVNVSMKLVHSFTLQYFDLSAERNKITIDISSDKSQSVKATIVDVSGRVYYSAAVPLTSGTNSFTKNISGLTKGIYFLKISSPDDIISRPLRAE